MFINVPGSKRVKIDYLLRGMLETKITSSKLVCIVHNQRDQRWHHLILRGQGETPFVSSLLPKSAYSSSDLLISRLSSYSVYKCGRRL